MSAHHSLPVSWQRFVQKYLSDAGVVSNVMIANVETLVATQYKEADAAAAQVGIDFTQYNKLDDVSIHTCLDKY